MSDIVVQILELVAGITGTIVASFLGARVAFRLERRRDLELQRDNEADGLQSAIFLLCRQLSVTGRLKQEVLDPLRHDRNRDIRVPVVPGKMLVNARVDFDWISHMLRDHEESAGLAFLIMASDDSVSSLYEVAEARREFHAVRIQPKLEEAGITEFSEERAQQIRYVCGATDSELLRRHTDQLYAACDTAVMQLEQALNEARRISQIAFPGYEFKFVLPDWLHHTHSGHIESLRAQHGSAAASAAKEVQEQEGAPAHRALRHAGQPHHDRPDADAATPETASPDPEK